MSKDQIFCPTLADKLQQHIKAVIYKNSKSKEEADKTGELLNRLSAKEFLQLLSDQSTLKNLIQYDFDIYEDIKFLKNDENHIGEKPLNAAKIRNFTKNKIKPKILPSYKFNKYGEISGHNGLIERMLCDSNYNSTYIFTGGHDGIIKVWNIEKQLLIRSLYGHCALVIDICIDHSGHFLASADISGKLLIWELSKLTLLHEIDLKSEIIFCEFVRNEVTETVKSIKIDQRGKTKKTSNIEKERESLVLLTSDGNFTKISFDHENISIDFTNGCLRNESIKAICITDGGRFICCGGDWPFLLAYDVYDQNRIIVMEDFSSLSGVQITNICASKSNLNIATSYLNTICFYSFVSLGCSSDNSLCSSSFINRLSYGSRGLKKNPLNGYFNKFYIDIMEFNIRNKERITVERISFTESNLLICVCSDNLIRIYEKETLITYLEGEIGSIFVHPYLEVFCIVSDSKISVYKISDEEGNCKILKNSTGSEETVVTMKKVSNSPLNLILVQTIPVSIPPNDCLFSNNGEFFIISDDSGTITSYKINSSLQPKTTAQFFRCDFNNQLAISLSQLYGQIQQKTQGKKTSPSGFEPRSLVKAFISNEKVPADFLVVLRQAMKGDSDLETAIFNYLYGHTVDPTGCNSFWHRLNYEITEESPLSNFDAKMRIENSAAIHLNRLKLNSVEMGNKMLKARGALSYIQPLSESSDYDISEYIPTTGNIDQTEINLYDELFAGNSPTRGGRRIIDLEESDFDHKTPKRRRMIASESAEEETQRKQQSIVLRSNKNTNLESSSTSEIILRKTLRSMKDEEKGILLRSQNKTREFPGRVIKIESSLSEEESTDSLSEQMTVTESDDGLITADSSETADLNATVSESAEQQNDVLETDPILYNKIYNWIINCYFNKNDEIYFDSKAYKQFLSSVPETIKNSMKFNTDIKTGYYKIKSINVGFATIPYLKLKLEKNTKIFNNVNFYETGEISVNSTIVACLKSQKDNFDVYDTVSIVSTRNSVLSIKRGQIVESRALLIYLKGSWFSRSQIYVGNNQLDFKAFLINVKDQQYLPMGEVESYVNYEKINCKIHNFYYKSADELISDFYQVYQSYRNLEQFYCEYAEGKYREVKRELKK
ncbi:hypothetical protein NUSPORA_01739 [Nucleospora cyclopteri]